VDPAGRLDQDSSGLLILSSDGDFLNRITHPRYHLPKRYEVILDQPLSQAEMNRLRTGIRLRPENQPARMVELERVASRPPTYQATLITGYNRQIRRSVEALGKRVIRLTRLTFGPILLDPLPPGGVRPLEPEEIRRLLDLSMPPAQPEQGQHRPQEENRPVENHRQYD
jgi:23S rRNA pseudouridine2605 synthase